MSSRALRTNQLRTCGMRQWARVVAARVHIGAVLSPRPVFSVSPSKPIRDLRLYSAHDKLIPWTAVSFVAVPEVVCVDFRRSLNKCKFMITSKECNWGQFVSCKYSARAKKEGALRSQLYVAPCTVSTSCSSVTPTRTVFFRRTNSRCWTRFQICSQICGELVSD